LSLSEEHRHIESLLKRMAKAVAGERKKAVIDPFRPLFEGASSLLLDLPSGRRCLFALQPGKRTKAKRMEQGWIVDIGASTHRRTLHRFLWRLLADRELPSIRSLVQEINRETLRVRISGVRIAWASSQWGSCSANGIIMLNASLLLLPEECLRYVIIHELAHRLVHRHSTRFWKTVACACPEYDSLRARLRMYRFCSL
jgi:predicted metal-dependent hydrolase